MSGATSTVQPRLTADFSPHSVIVKIYMQGYEVFRIMTEPEPRYKIPRRTTI